ncbi:hypothetical protein SAMN05660653_02683 [Desulfonatronum thiosulfatophilum]|uniref:Lipoprotein n=1 Tax=Desulfonatronum thiosulfatophilum TaxID=617002 RepID=A0A1G6E8U6_9BACT|nr:hypothetical protein [Desulfonatronum thiosulfatophilum]SDB53869.1 hypothetical protein SAMN05660653_02683 [Desulfonatronum thiosulfatophilum]
MRNWTMTNICLWSLILLLSACAPRPAAPQLPVEHTLAVAGFHQPLEGWQLLSTSRAEQARTLSPGLLDELDAMLMELLGEGEIRAVLGTEATKQCQELVLSGVNTERGGISGLRYWMDVGACTRADYLLVPQILEWREREGGEWGVTEPGRVVLELTLLNIPNQRIAQRFQYDERQRSLSEDLLQADRFFRRGGKWLPTKELVRDGLREGMREMGL